MEKPNSVLIVEDDANIRDMYRSALESADFIVYLAKDGQEAVTKALENHPTVILMDIMLPKMNGHEATEKIRLDDWGKNAKIIFLTNMSDAENVVHAIEAKSEDYIVKAHTTPKDVVNQVRIAAHAQE